MTARALLPRLLLLLVIAGAAAWLAFHRDQLDPALLERTVRDLGPWAPLIHVLLFAVGTVFFVPGAIFGLAGGALFGPLWGTLLNLAGGDARRDRFLPHRALCCRGLGEIEGWRTSSASRRRGGSRGLALCCLRASCPAVSVQPAQLCARPDANPAHTVCPCVACLHGARHACLCLVGLRWAGSARRQPVGHQLRL